MNTIDQHGRRRKRAVVAVWAAVALAVGLAAPAEASTTSSGCTVAPTRPIFAGFDLTGTKMFDALVVVSCDAGLAPRTVEVQQLIFEQDQDRRGFEPDEDDRVGDYELSRTFSADGGSLVIHSRHRLPDTEDGGEEMYQAVRFRVSSNGVISSWTFYEGAAYTAMPN